MKKVTMIHGDIIFYFMKLQQAYHIVGGRHSGGGRGITEDPGSVNSFTCVNFLNDYVKKMG
jgi:hypothetical protein